MTVQSIANQRNSVFSLDEILRDIPETATEELFDNEKTYQNYQEELNQELKTTDRVWLEFHAGQCEQFGKAAKSMLYRIVNSSIGCPENSIAAANAITILKVMKVSFSCLDLRGVQIPEADLSSAILDGSDLLGANLENVDLTNASLNGTNMSKTNLKKVKFEIPNVLIHTSEVFSSSISPDNKYLISEDLNYIYFWHLPSATCIKKIVRSNRGKYEFKIKVFTPDGHFLYICDKRKYIDIWSVGDFKLVKKWKIPNNEMYSDFYFLPNEPYLITYNIVMGQRSYLRVWKIRKTEDAVLDIILNNEIAISDYSISNIQFSKKYPVFYFLKAKLYEPNSKIYLSIYNIKEFSKAVAISNISDGNSFGIDIFLPLKDNTILSSLNILVMSESDEEILFIKTVYSIYSIRILKKNKHTWTQTSAQITKVLTEVAPIYAMQIFIKTCDLVYVCNKVICLYSIKNNQPIGKFRLLDTLPRGLSFSLDGSNVYMGSLNKIFTYSLSTLKNSKYISYQMDSAAAGFLPDMRSIMSLNDSFHQQTYDIETGKVLKTNILQKIKLHALKMTRYKIIYEISSDSQHILLINNGNYIGSYTGCILGFETYLGIVNIENEEMCLDVSKHTHAYVLSSNFEYIVLAETREVLAIYQTIPSKKCLGKFSLKPFLISGNIAISTDFLNTPKIALISKSKKVVVCNFAFKGEVLELLSRKELLLEVKEVLKVQFIENSSKLVLACKKKLIVCSTEGDFYEEYNIRASCADISCDGSLLIYYSLNIYERNSINFQLCLWSVTQRKFLVVKPLSLVIMRLQISPDNRYVIAKTVNGGIYVWEIVENAFRLLWRTSHNLQAQGLILSDNNLEDSVEEELITKMGALKLGSI